MMLLDTHVWVWLVQRDRRLGAATLQAITEAASAGNIAISAISLWEIAMLARRDRLILGRPILDWIQASSAAIRFVTRPITPEIAVDSTALSDGFHGDPADRMIVSTARIDQSILATADRAILSWAALGRCRTLNATD